MARMPGEQSLEAESEEPKPSPTCASGDTSWPSICWFLLGTAKRKHSSVCEVCFFT
jgi:hypothetical protein